MAVTYKEYQCKSMLRTHKFVDNWFWESASISPYKACEHGCNYCDGRSQKYHASEDFDNLIYVKINCIEVLKKELDKLFPKQKTLSDFGFDGPQNNNRSKMVVAVSSGISDAYQPAEKKYKLTQKILKLFLEYNVPTYIMTKSHLVLRDLDILKKINEASWCNVSFSFSTLDKRTAAIFEPKASSPKKRMEAMKIISDSDILTGVTYMPIIPYITDSKEQLDRTIRTSKEHGAKYLLAASMTMRDMQCKRFYETIKKHYPDLLEKYNTLYKNGYQPKRSYLRSLYLNISRLCKTYKMQQYVPRYIPDADLKKNIETSTTLFLISYFFGLSGERYKDKEYRRVGQFIEDMDEDILLLYKDGRLREIPEITKDTRSVIEEYLKTGKSQYLEELTS
jgi:DNA repair photolyase